MQKINPSKIVQDLALSKLESGDEKYVRFSALPLKTRKNLVIAEIGVENGVNALRLLRNLDIKKMYLVDWYKPTQYYDKKLVKSCQKNAHKILKPHKDKIFWVEMDSVWTAKHIPEKFDYVYIDGDHSFSGVYRDIVAWYPKVKTGGILGGHDFTTFSACRNGVMKFALEKDLPVTFKFQDWRIQL